MINSNYYNSVIIIKVVLILLIIEVNNFYNISRVILFIVVIKDNVIDKIITFLL